MIALHKNKGKSVATCLKSRTDYAQNPNKTQQGELVSSYECSPLTVDEEFMLSKRQYELMTGRRQKNDVIAYQIRQSFKPGEITAEEANKVGYELAMRFTKGKYAFIVATHTDREHIHNHIMLDNKISSFHSPAVPPDLFSTDATALKMVSILFDNGLITADIYHQVISRYSA